LLAPASLLEIVASTSPTLTEMSATPPAEKRPEGDLVRLRDGSRVWIRPVLPGDEPALRLFLEALCPEALRLRFFSGAIDLGRAAQWATHPTTGFYGLVAQDENQLIMGHALYVQLAPERAEVAVEVADSLHGCGLGTILIERLAAIAEQRGITHFVAEVLCENHAMLDVFREGFDARVVRHDGPQERVEFLTSGWRLAHQRFHLTTESEG
jgi:GNAT superfamily N-acetyltransferase